MFVYEFELKTNLEYPVLTILVKDNYACVHYFQNEGGCGHYAYIDNNGITDEYITFNVGTENSEIQVSKDLIIPAELAYTAAIDFFNSNHMSKRLNWFML